MDMYYKSLPEGIDPLNYNFDEPKAIDIKGILKDLKSIMKYEKFYSPQYDFKLHKSLKKVERKIRTNLIIFEGIFLFYFKELREKLNYKIYLEATDEEIFKRRLKRDLKKRGSKLEFVKNQLERFVFLGNYKYVERYKKYSDLIVPANLSIKEKKKIILDELKKILLKYLNED